jgi:hypothetical protein
MSFLLSGLADYAADRRPESALTRRWSETAWRQVFAVCGH